MSFLTWVILSSILLFHSGVFRFSVFLFVGFSPSLSLTKCAPASSRVLVSVIEEVGISAIHELMRDVSSISFFLFTCLRGLVSITEGSSRSVFSRSMIASLSISGTVAVGVSSSAATVGIVASLNVLIAWETVGKA